MKAASIESKQRNGVTHPQSNGNATLAPQADQTVTEAMTSLRINRVVTIERDTDTGSFGFTAGSERPVVIRQVNVGGPSWGKLQSKDEILKIDSHSVESATQFEVFNLLRNCKLVVTITVGRQQHLDATVSQSEKADATVPIDDRSNHRYTGARSIDRKMPRPKHVRFAEDVAGAWQLTSQLPSLLRQRSVDDDDVMTASHFARGAVKVFFENDQTKTFGQRTRDMTVSDVLESIRDKLQLKSLKSFGLVLTSTSSSCADQKMSLLGEHLSIEQVCERIRKMWLQDEQVTVQCCFRYVFMPTAIDDDLVNSDSAAFDYLYTQCCNDVISERFASELSCDGVVHLAALGLLRAAIDEGIIRQRSETVIKTIESKLGLERFVPASLLTATRRKTLLKELDRYVSLKQNLLMRSEIGSNSTPTKHQQQQLMSDRDKMSRWVKRRYVNRLATLSDFGGRYFDAALADRTANVRIFVGPRRGIEYVLDSTRSTLAGLRQLAALRVEEFPLRRRPLFDNSLVRVVLDVCENAQDNAAAIGDHVLRRENILLAADQTEDFIAFVSGYYRLLMDRPLEVVFEVQSVNRDANNNYNSLNTNVSSQSFSVQSNFIIDTKLDEIDEVTYEAEVDSADDEVAAVNEIAPPTLSNHITEELNQDEEYLNDTLGSLNSFANKYPDNDVIDRRLPSTVDSEAHLDITGAQLELLPPLSTVVHPEISAPFYSSTLATQSDITTSMSSSPSNSFVSSPSNSSFGSGSIHLFDQPLVGEDEVSASKLAASTSPTSHCFSDDDSAEVIIYRVTQGEEIDARWNAPASGSMTSAHESSGALTDRSPVNNNDSITDDVLDLTLILPPDDIEPGDDLDDDAESSPTLPDYSSISPPVEFAEIEGLTSHQVFINIDHVLDLRLIPPPGDLDLGNEDTTGDDVTLLPDSRHIHNYELSDLVYDWEAWKIGEVHSLTRREETQFGEQSVLDKDGGLLQDEDFDIDHRPDQSSTNCIERYCRPEAVTDVSESTSPLVVSIDKRCHIEGESSAGAHVQLPLRSDVELVHGNIDAFNCDNKNVNDARLSDGVSPGSISLDAEVYHKHEPDSDCVVEKYWSDVHLNDDAQLPPPLPMTLPPPLDEDNELINSCPNNNATSFISLTPLSMSRPEVDLDVASSDQLIIHSSSPSSTLMMTTTRGSSQWEFPSSTVPLLGNYSRHPITGCLEPNGLERECHADSGTMCEEETEAFADDAENLAFHSADDGKSNEFYRFPPKASVSSMPPPVAFSAPSTVCNISDGDDDDDFRSDAELPTPLSPLVPIDDDQQQFDVEPPPPPPPLPTSPPPIDVLPAREPNTVAAI